MENTKTIKDYLTTHQNRKDLIRSEYQKLILEGFCKNDAMTQAMQNYENQLIDCLDNGFFN